MSESAFGAQYGQFVRHGGFWRSTGGGCFFLGAVQSWTVRLGGDLRLYGLRCAAFWPIQHESDTASFTVWPAPSAAGLVTFSIWVALANDVAQPSFVLASVMAVVTAGAGLLMVSNFSYYSPKPLICGSVFLFVTLVLIALAFAVVTVDPPAISNPVCCLFDFGATPKGPFWHTLQKRASKPE
ncbi:MAG: hypothetical protein CM15mP120_27970 [Pseudomonadota bacterium]|nr:MAG: hypothetical protein CM15mP120_27970 [Pseudomonadota bacterium]